MNRIDELTLLALDGEIDPAGLAELEELVERDERAAARQRRLLAIEIARQCEDDMPDLAIAVLGALEARRDTSPVPTNRRRGTILLALRLLAALLAGFVVSLAAAALWSVLRN